MLNPNNDRLDYGNILLPPLNYELDFAIGTTYSLDLDSLVGASISLGLSQETDTILRKDQIFLLDALRRTGDKIALFCENGRIRNPTKPTPLYIMLEEMVFQVNTPKKEHLAKYPSFHPKFWLIRYKNKEEVIYRVIVLSRNLTFGRDWDISFTMDGKKVENSSDSIQEKNKNLKIFLNYLREYSTNSDKKEKIEDIISELDYVEFYLNTNTFKDFDFIPNGVKEDVSIKNEDYLFCSKDFDDLVIISPFLSKDVIECFNQRANDSGYNQKSSEGSKYEGLYLFTRKESLSELKDADCSKFEIFILKDEILDGESLISGESDLEDPISNGDDKSDAGESISKENEVDESEEKESDAFLRQDIHAKIYFVRKGSQVDLYFGSLNASRNALVGNVEFMVRLKTSENKFDLDRFLNDIFCGAEIGDLENPWEKVHIEEIDVDEESDSNKKDLDAMMKFIAHLNVKSEIIPDNEYYKINLNVVNYSDFEKYPNSNDFDVVVKPLLPKNVKPESFSENVSFEKIRREDLSTFFVITIEKNDDEIERVIKIETEGMPEDREKDLFSIILENKKGFIRYVAMLLGEDSILDFTTNLSTREEEKGDSQSPQKQIHLLPLYEKMLAATVHNPARFREIEYLIQTLSGNDNVVPKGFEELYNTFKEVLNDE